MMFKKVRIPRFRSIREATKFLGIAAFAAFGGVCVTLVATCYACDVGVKDAAKILVIRSIEAATEIHDPVEARITRLGPAPGIPRALDGYDRIEDRLPISGAEESPGTGRTRIRLVSVDNKRIVRSRFTFRYQPHNEPRLHELRSKYRLDEVVASASDEFGEMVLLREWARSQFYRRDYQPMMRDFDALTVLDRGLRNTENLDLDKSVSYDPCHFFPLFYCQIMLSMGHQARLVSVGHGMAEVWSNQFEKWVLMDAELNLHYEEDGTPLNMMELHDLNFGGDVSRVEVIRGSQTSDPNTTMAHLKIEELEAEDAVRWFKDYIEINSMRNDWMTNGYFRGHPARGEQATLAFDDAHTPRRSGMPYCLRSWTSRPEDFNWTLNQAEIRSREVRSPDESVQLAFETVTPNFDHFEITIDGSRRLESSSQFFRWDLHDGRNTLKVRPMNRFGVRGIASTVALNVLGPGEEDRGAEAATASVRRQDMAGYASRSRRGASE